MNKYNMTMTWTLLRIQPIYDEEKEGDDSGKVDGLTRTMAILLVVLVM